jgi:hypothetical protein
LPTGKETKIIARRRPVQLLCSPTYRSHRMTLIPVINQSQPMLVVSPLAVQLAKRTRKRASITPNTEAVEHCRVIQYKLDYGYTLST